MRNANGKTHQPRSRTEKNPERQQKLEGRKIWRTTLNTDFLVRCVNTLDSAFTQVRSRGQDDELYDIFLAASVKEFEIVREQSGSLLKRRLRSYFASNRQADRLTFKDIFRHAALHGLIGVEASERWMAYPDNRNDTAHDYGEGFAETTIGLLEQFIPDARELARIIGDATDE